MASLMADYPVWHILLPFALWTAAILAFFLIVKYGIARADRDPNRGFSGKDADIFEKERKEWEERKKRWGSR